MNDDGSSHVSTMNNGYRMENRYRIKRNEDVWMHRDLSSNLNILEDLP